MSRGKFDDFTDKFGFHDGESTEPRDFQARDAICRGLNKLLKTVVAIPFDRAGVHNSCMIVFFYREDGWTEEQYLRSDWKACSQAQMVALDELPEGFEIDDLINECYDEIDEGMDGEPYGQAAVDSVREGRCVVRRMTDEEFAKTDGFQSPYCRGRSTKELGEPHLHEDEILMECECHDCGRTYSARLGIIGYHADKAE